MVPYATALRPRTLDEFIGQEHFLYPGSLLYNAIKNKSFTSSVFFGPPGTGKTTLARIIAQEMDSEFKEINASETGTKELKELLRVAREEFIGLRQKPTYLYIDEFHRWNKLQQDSLLKTLEEGIIRFIGSTTENPYFSINNAILSRIGHIYEFRKLAPEHIYVLLKNAIEDKEHGFGERKADYKDGDLRLIADMADGDARLAIDALGFILDNGPADKSGKVKLSKKLIDEAFQKKSIYYDKEEDRYNLLSALQKSVRGSDPDAALHYLARLIEGGADLLMISRRLLVMAAEDVGIAYPNAVAITHAAVESARLTGFPEARIQLAFATVLLASLPKTNRAYVAYEKAASDLKSKDVPDIPDFLKDSHYAGSKKLGRGFGYLNPHDTNGQPKQRYLPQEMLDAGTRYYFPRDIGLEKNFKKYLEELWK